MMSYTFEIVELDASEWTLKMPNEQEKDFLERVVAAEGKNFFSLNIISLSSERQRAPIYSPYFRRNNITERNETFKECVRLAAKEICRHEGGLPPPESEKPLIVVP